MSSSSRDCPSYYEGPPSPQCYTLAGALGSGFSTSEQYKTVPNLGQYPNCPQSVCRYAGSGGDQCSQLINCATVPEHFRVAHGVRDMARSSLICCRWQGCEQRVLRHNFIRRIREWHLMHQRLPGHTNISGMEEAQGTRESPSQFPDIGSDNPSLVPPGTNLRPRRSGIISKLSRFFQRLKSPRGTQEKTTPTSSATDARSEHTSDGEHTRACCVVCGFKVL